MAAAHAPTGSQRIESPAACLPPSPCRRSCTKATTESVTGRAQSGLAETAVVESQHSGSRSCFSPGHYEPALIPHLVEPIEEWSRGIAF